MAAKSRSPIIFTSVGVLTRTHLDRPDDKAPEGSKWTPDGKYKATLILTDLGDIEAKVCAYAKAQLGSDYPGDSELRTPWKEGGTDDTADSILLVAKSKFQPEFYDAKGNVIGGKDTPRYGDRGCLKFSLYVYAKAEKVMVGKKMQDVMTYGVSAQLLAVQVVEKSKGAGAAGGGFSQHAGGYEASGGFERHDEDDTQPDEKAERRRAPAPTGDDADF